MKKQLAIAAGIAGVLALAAGGVAVNAATLNATQASDLGRVPGTVADDHGVDATRTPHPTPSASGTAEPGDDDLPQHSGLDDGANHDAGDDNLPRHSGQDDGAGHDVGDDHGGATGGTSGGSGNSGSGSSGSGSGSSGSGSSGSSGSDDSGHHGGSDDSGHGGHGGSGRDD
jgi:hypothetical protein